jgi:DNA-binding transcriptional MerR regulator
MGAWQGFYSTAQVSRLAGVPKRTLYHCKARGIITPSIQIVGAGGQRDEGYSYADLAIAKLLRGLRNKQLNLRSIAEEAPSQIAKIPTTALTLTLQGVSSI